MNRVDACSVQLPLLRVPLTGLDRPVVLVSARGLWNREVAPWSPEAVVRAYQRTVRCVVPLRADGEPGSGLCISQFVGALERCLEYSSPRIEIPFLVEVASWDLLAGPLRASLGSRLARCTVVRRAAGLVGDGIFPLFPIETCGLEPRPPWAWRVPIETILDPVMGSRLVNRLVEIRAHRLVIDSVDVLTDVQLAREWSPSREAKLLYLIGARLPLAEIWLVTDLLEGLFLSASKSIPLG